MLVELCCAGAVVVGATEEVGELVVVDEDELELEVELDEVEDEEL